MRRPGLETRLIPMIVFLRSSGYLRAISRWVPALPSALETVKPAMKPSRSRTFARLSFNFELGIFTVSNIAELALRIRVSMSAMGSVIVMIYLPTRLRDAGNLAGVDHLTQADTAQAELAVHRARSTASLATRVGTRRELRGLLLLDAKSFLCHIYLVSCLKGKPYARKNARPCSSVAAVVTIVMSKPRGASILS